MTDPATGLLSRFLEPASEHAMGRVWELRAALCQRQGQAPIHSKGVQVGEHDQDLLVADRVMVELQAVRPWARVQMAVVLVYLAAAGQLWR